MKGDKSTAILYFMKKCTSQHYMLCDWYPKDLNESLIVTIPDAIDIHCVHITNIEPHGIPRGKSLKRLWLIELNQFVDDSGYLRDERFCQKCDMQRKFQGSYWTNDFYWKIVGLQ